MPSWSTGGEGDPSDGGGEGDGSGGAGEGAGKNGGEHDKAEDAGEAEEEESSSFTQADEAKLRSLHSTIALLLIHERMERLHQSQGAAAVLRTTSSARFRPSRLYPCFDARALGRS